MMEISKKTCFSIITILLLSAVFTISAESIYEGSASMGYYGEFPFTGYYGASNSFKVNDFVEIENLENGKKTRLIVVKRADSSPVLMLISNEAAQELGIYQNDIVRVKARKISAGQQVQKTAQDDLAYNPDPDLNPAAALGNPEDLVYQEEAVEPEPELEPQPQPQPQPITIAEAEPVKEPEPVIVPEPEPEPEEIVITPQEVAPIETTEPEPLWSDETESRNEGEFASLSEFPPSIDGLKDAEVLVTEEEVPSDIAADSPEKPFDWPDTLGVSEPEPEPEPIYLTMDELKEGRPLDEVVEAGEMAHAAETDVLWPDRGNTSDPELAEAPEAAVLSEDRLSGAAPLSGDAELSGAGLEYPESRLELVSSGLVETGPAMQDSADFKLSMLPELIEKESEEDAEYITEASDYYAPAVKESAVAVTGLPSPEPDIPVEVIAVLVGDYGLSETVPESVALDTAYIDSPEIVSDEMDTALINEYLAEAVPMSADDGVLVSSALPKLPSGDSTELIDVANGYISPEEADFAGEIADYPNPNPDLEPGEETILVDVANGYAVPELADFKGDVADYPNAADASEPVDLPSSEDELEYAEAPLTDEGSTLPEMTELPELAEAAEADEADTEAVDMTVPEYDENLEVSLVPAEVRPPELIEEDTGLDEGEPENAEPLVTIVTDRPELEEAPPAEAVAVEPEPEPASVIVEVKPGPAMDLTPPEQVQMVSKLMQQKHYLQLGAFKEKNSAIKAAGSLVEVYPVTILTDEATAGVSYKLLLGPLSADESGIMLYNFRAGGYSDAFIRRIE